MDIDINIVFCSTVGALGLCVCCACIRGEYKRQRDLERARQALRDSATPVEQVEVQAVVVMTA
jgi:hypothetical protein